MQVLPEWFKKMKLIEYKYPFCVFSSGEKKLLLIFCVSSWLQKPENGSYETLILPCGLNISERQHFWRSKEFTWQTKGRCSTFQNEGK